MGRDSQRRGIIDNYGDWSLTFFLKESMTCTNVQENGNEEIYTDINMCYVVSFICNR